MLVWFLHLVHLLFGLYSLQVSQYEFTISTSILPSVCGSLGLLWYFEACMMSDLNPPSFSIGNKHSTAGVIRLNADFSGLPTLIPTETALFSLI